MRSEMRFKCAGTSVSFAAESTQIRFSDSSIVIAVAVFFRLISDALLVLWRRRKFLIHLSVHFKFSLLHYKIENR